MVLKVLILGSKLVGSGDVWKKQGDNYQSRDGSSVEIGILFGWWAMSVDSLSGAVYEFYCGCNFVKGTNSCNNHHSPA